MLGQIRRRSGGAHGGGGGDLPDGYTRLQYIYNPSNAYIDTGVLLTSNDTVDIEWTDQLVSQGGDRFLCGLNGAFFMNMYYGLTRTFCGWGSSTAFLGDTFGRRLRVEQGMFYFYGSDGTTVSSTADKTSFTFSASKTIYLFCWNNGNNVPQYPFKQAGIKYFIIEGKFNGIPCIDPNNVVGMYDTVNMQFHSSPNGTAFTAGPLYE